MIDMNTDKYYMLQTLLVQSNDLWYKQSVYMLHSSGYHFVVSCYKHILWQIDEDWKLLCKPWLENQGCQQQLQFSTLDFYFYK